MSDKIVVKDPVMLDKTGVELVRVGKSIAAALWREKFSDEVPIKDVNFYDYDGTRVYSYTRAEFLGLSALPANPAHNGLTAQGWNWELTTAQAYVQKYGYLEIGQNYITDDGKTRLYVRLDKTERFAVKLMFNQSIASGVTIDWGDGTTETPEAEGNVTVTHTYAEAGDYVITMEAAEECAVRLGQGTNAGATLSATGGNGKQFFTQGLRNAGGTSGRNALLALEIGNGVTDIGAGAFYMCTNLETITIPNTLTTIRNIAFHGCFSLKGIVIPDGVTQIMDFVFGYCYGIKAICLPGSLTTLGTNTFRTNLVLRRLTIPEGVTNIPASVFCSCHLADVITIPDTVVGLVGNYAFKNCYSIKSVKLPTGVTAIGDYSFDQCYNLVEISLNEGITTIGKGAFRSLFAVESMVLPSTITSINQFAFLYNDGTNTFHIKATVPPVLEPTAFTAIGEPLIIYVPYSEDHSILNAYLDATGWSGKGDNLREEDAE